jgi:hypothetical protein
MRSRFSIDYTASGNMPLKTHLRTVHQSQDPRRRLAIIDFEFEHLLGYG